MLKSTPSKLKYMREYNQRAEVKAQRKIYDQLPRIKASRLLYSKSSQANITAKIYNARVDVKARKLAYSRSENGMAVSKAWRNSPAGIVSRKKWDMSANGKATRKAWGASADGKFANKKYRQSAHGRQKKRDYYLDLDTIARRKAWRNTPVQKLRIARYYQSPSYITYSHSPQRVRANRLQKQTPSAKAQSRAHSMSAEGKAYRKKWCSLPHVKPKLSLNSKKYRSSPKGKITRVRSWAHRYKTNQQFRIASLLRGRLYGALKKFGKGKRMASIKYGVDFTSIIEHLGVMPNDGRKYHIDHIIPLCSFDLTNLDEIKRAFAPENHQWLPDVENLTKNAHWTSSNGIHMFRKKPLIVLGA